MDSKKSCLNSKLALIGITSLLILTGCASRNTRALPPMERPGTSRPLPPSATGNRETASQPVLPPTANKPLPPQTPPPAVEGPVSKPSPMAMAALALSEKGQAYLRDGKPDEAIRALERAVNLHPRNGENYYYLAEAWLMKKNAAQAKEFNLLAAIHTATDPEWARRVRAQNIRISQLK